MEVMTASKWMDSVIKEEEITRYLEAGRDFIDDVEIENLIEENRNPDPKKIRDILDQSLALQRLEPHQTAALLNVEDEDLWEEMFKTGHRPQSETQGLRTPHRDLRAPLLQQPVRQLLSVLWFPKRKHDGKKTQIVNR